MRLKLREFNEVFFYFEFGSFVVVIVFGVIEDFQRLELVLVVT